MFLVPRSGQPLLADSVMEISANLTLAAEAIAVGVRYRAVCSHLLCGQIPWGCKGSESDGA